MGAPLRRAVFAALAMTATAALGADVRAQQPFEVHEKSITELQAAMRAGEVTARQLVDAYIARIDAYDRRGPSLNSIIVVHPRAREIADSLDGIFVRTGEFVGPLHGIPIIVKDNYDTYDLPTTAGSASLADSVPPQDATMVAKLRAAGAIVLAKSNMAEFAFSPVETIGSALPGYTFNPYALNRVPAGSSGGTAAAVAASFGAAGLGTDTGNSIRGPSSHTALFGIRPTIGLTSRAGIVPLFLERDVGGPMARSVTDAALLLDVLAGSDPRDPATAEADAHRPERYTAFLDRDALRGARIGVARRISNRSGADPEVLQRFEEALDAMRAAGATIVDSVELAFMDSIRPVLCSGFRRDLENYLATRGDAAPYRTLAEILESGKYHASIEQRMRNALADTTAGDPERCRRARETHEAWYAALKQVLDEFRLDAVAYPTWSNPPRLVGDHSTPAGDNSQTPVPAAGVPAVSVPMGWVRDGTLPVGLQLLGDRWNEPRLIALAYAYEQATRHRRPPASTPPLLRR